MRVRLPYHFSRELDVSYLVILTSEGHIIVRTKGLFPAAADAAVLTVSL